MITVSKLAKAFGDRTLFEDVSLQLNAGSRYGLVGANGSGKTTFLKILSGDEPASDGTVTFPSRANVGVLRQDHFLDDAEKILHVAMMGDTAMWSALSERDRIIDHGDGDANRLGEIDDALALGNGYTLEARAGAILEGLGIGRPSHDLPLSTLSGGFKLRVLLAQVLVGGPDALLLDEPTNHLDILSIRWLEKFLSSYRGAALVISHDQRFLDNAVTHVLDVDYGTIKTYTGNYTAFVAQKEAASVQKEAEVARAEKLIAEKRAFVERFGAKATKARQAQSRLKQIEKIEVAEIKPSSRRTPSFAFKQQRPSGRDVLEVAAISKSYGEKSVLRDVSLTVRRGEKIAIIGTNGLGKSTLLKIIVGHLDADGGAVRHGHVVRTGYFAQDHHDLLTMDASKPRDYVWEAGPSAGVATVRGHLGRVLFSGDDVDKPVGALSGGEAARLIFCRIIVEKPNLLVLDEPTNHLDLEAIGALVDALAAFEGTVLFVSHDRWFVSRLATRIVEIAPEGIREFPGTYAEYLDRCGDDHLDADAVVLKAKADKAKRRADGSGSDGLSWEQRKRRKNRQAALPAKRDAVVASIEAAEARKRAIAAAFAAEGFFTSTPQPEIDALVREEADLEKKIAGWMAEWEALESEMTGGRG
jgi:ATPase subunit of ABC transporter with duplicated ATPase domains